MAYLAIPVVLIYFARRRRDLPFKHLFWLFGAFIVCCGLTHLLAALMFSYPAYRLDGLLKAITAAVSLATAAVLTPRALSLRSPEQLAAEIKERTNELESLNKTLETEVAERQRAEQRLIGFIDEAPNAIVAVGRDGRIQLVNRLAEEMFGYKREELLGRTVEALVPERYHKHHADLRNGFLAMPQTRAMGAGRELFALRSDGSEFPVEIGLRPMETEDGTVVLAAIVDITERLRSEEERERFFRVSENLLCVAGMDGYFKQVNPAFERLLGFSSEEMLAIPYLELVHHDDLAATIAELHKLSAGGPTDHFELRLRTRDGSYRWFLFNAVLHDGDMIYASGSDITERKAAEERLISVQLEAAELSGIRKTAATYAHQINNPLTGILGYIQLLLDRDQDDQDTHEILKETLDAACRIRDVTRKISDLDSPRSRPYLEHSEMLDLMDHEGRRQN